ncbi:MAG: hypothetical protein ACM3XM_06990 [Mycobacterium leprae]
MHEIVVKQEQIQKAIPFMMPRSVELYPVGGPEGQAIRQAAAVGALFVRVDRPDGEQIPVKKIWPDPHDPQRITLLLG